MKMKEDESEREKLLTPKEVVFDNENCNAFLSVERPEIPERIIKEANKQGLIDKPEFHISIITSENSRALMDFFDIVKGNDEIKEQIQSDFMRTHWRYELLDSYFLLKRHYTNEELIKSGHQNVPEHDRFTLIQAVRLDQLTGYYERLSALTGITFGTPFPHVTLYSNSDYEPLVSRGIAVCSKEDLDIFTEEKL